MKYIPMNLYDKRLRSKASSAGRLSLNNLAFSNSKDSSIFVVTIATQSQRGEGKGEGVVGYFNLVFGI
jgi:hypothetical protein